MKRLLEDFWWSVSSGYWWLTRVKRQEVLEVGTTSGSGPATRNACRVCQFRDSDSRTVASCVVLCRWVPVNTVPCVLDNKASTPASNVVDTSDAAGGPFGLMVGPVCPRLPDAGTKLPTPRLVRVLVWDCPDRVMR